MPRGVYERKPRGEKAAPKKKGRPSKSARAPANDGAYAAVIFDLRKKRESISAELVKIDAAILAVEALA